MPTVLAGSAGLTDHANTHLGKSAWADMTFDTIQAFADCTGDQQWIHVDRERIARESPFGAPIAHGYLTLALIAGHFFEVLELREMAMVINYGANKVRFPSPLKEGDSYRLSMDLGEVTAKAKGWYEALFRCTIEVQDSDKPACVAECVYRFLPAG